MGLCDPSKKWVSEIAYHDVVIDSVRTNFFRVVTMIKMVPV